jgi:amidase
MMAKSKDPARVRRWQRMNPEMSDPHIGSAEVAKAGAGELRKQFEDGTTTSAELTAILMERIAAIDHSGPNICSVLRLNDRVVDDAAQLDAERAAGHVRGPLHGVPVLVKDNVDTVQLGATAGSLALEGVPVAADAVLVTRLRDAGLVIIGKTNLSEWANFRGRPSSSGWSAVGHQTANPFALNRTPGGSSSGSGAGVASGLAPIAVGTETNGSILCPAAVCGLVGLKPTVGLVSRTGVIPVSSSQDTAGPMARSVADAALLLDALASGPIDPGDAAMQHRPDRAESFVAALSQDLRGLRVGVVRDEGYFGYHLATDAVVEAMLGSLAAAGATVVDPVIEIGDAVQADEMTVLFNEFKAGLDAYLARRSATSETPGSPPPPRSLADVIAFNQAHEAEHLEVFPQDFMIRSAATSGLDDPAYMTALADNLRRTRGEGIDAVCLRLRLDALVAPTMPPAWQIDHVTGDSHLGCAWGQAAIAGYPSISLPVGEVRGMPVGLTIWGRAWSEATLLRIASAVEDQIAYRPAPSYRESVGLLE